MLLVGILFLGPSLRFEDFAKLHLCLTWLFCLGCLVVAMLRLRKLTAKD